MYLRLIKTVILFCLLFWQGVSFASVNGIWLDNNSHYWLLMQDTKNQVIAVQIDTDLSRTTTYLGLLDSQQLTLNSLTSENAVVATVNDAENQLSGLLTGSDGQAITITADLILSYEGNAYDGVWETSLGHYLAYTTLNSNNTPLVLVVDILIDPTNATISNDIFAGTLREASFTGVSIKEASKTLRLTFSSDTATGSYITVTGERPPKTETVNFTAIQTFAIQP
ncbi:hypothetical protein BegalDRAFT_0674 [Beggiatoa alba B18LD]|uniref:Uncharacterized protein n=1 Tax=Beggiatoa alba B18LD TaxID=395493 RepID=I3CD93_9GAMM|nr:hypothetical protein [Beggiatoa alba]EIJ41586.1 hypothetical protein BegalDRAFT_0674 [Beggiatoa alba B18LD]